MIQFIIYFLILLFTIPFLIIAIDLFFYYRDVFNRIHIGRWKNTEDWISVVKKINIEWLKKTPTVKLTDNENYIIIDIIKGRYKSNTIQSWQQAGSLLGAIDTENCENQINTFLNTKINFKTGKLKKAPVYLDEVLLAFSITKTSVDIDKIRPALDEIILLIDNSKSKNETVFYRNFISDIRFVDTIGFICPFLTFYGIKFNQPKYIDLAVLQIKDYIDKAFLEYPFLPVHAYDLEKGIPLGVYGWGRGLGWFILGVVDMYNELPMNHKHKEFIKLLIVKTAKDLLQFQKPNGSFLAMLAVDSSRHDSSITVLAGWLFFNNYLITKEKIYLESSKKCIESLMQVTRRNGSIDFCQGDTKGIGIYASTFDLMPFVQGLTIRLFESIKNHEKSC